MRLKDEQPREKLEKFGASNLSNSELLAIMLRTGSKDKNVLELSKFTLEKYDINYFKNIEYNELTLINGIGKVKAITLLASIEFSKRVLNSTNNLKQINNPKSAYDNFGFLIANKDKENFLILYLDNKKRVIQSKIMYKGTVDSINISPKEIFSLGIKLNSSSIIVMHNHPSNILIPSKSDITITKKIKDVGIICDIYLDDHIIAGVHSYFSFAENNLIH